MLDTYDRTSLPAGIATATGDTDTATLATAPAASGSSVGEKVGAAVEQEIEANTTLVPPESSLIPSALSPSASGGNGTNGTNGTGAGVRLAPTGVQVYVGPAVALIGAIGAGLAIFA